MIIIPVKAVAKPRMTKSDKWKRRKCVIKYREFCDQLKKYINQCPEILYIEFQIEMPRTWLVSKKKRLNLTPHRQTPDLDNLIKSIGDFSGNNDSYVQTICARKIWAYKPAIIIYTSIQEWIDNPAVNT